MSFHDNFSQSNKLDTKNQRANSTEMKFPMVNRKVRKKRLFRYTFIFINKRLTVALATKYRFK